MLVVKPERGRSREFVEMFAEKDRRNFLFREKEKLVSRSSTLVDFLSKKLSPVLISLRRSDSFLSEYPSRGREQVLNLCRDSVVEKKDFSLFRISEVLDEKVWRVNFVRKSLDLCWTEWLV